MRAIAGKTHRELFDDWTRSLLGVDVRALIAAGPPPALARALFARMLRDLGSDASAAGSAAAEDHACYALGYNLAVEFLADFEKRWALDAFRELDARIFAPAGVKPDWIFLEARALVATCALQTTGRGRDGPGALRAGWASSVETLP